jgi:hypothetical protein
MAEPENGALVVSAAPAALTLLEPLLQAHRRRRPVRIAPASCAIEGPLLQEAAAVLCVGGAGATPGRAVSSPFLDRPDGTKIPVGWLPEAGARLAVYARAAAEVQDRRLERRRSGPFLLLGEFDDRALNTVVRMQERMPREAAVHRWTSERLPRHALIGALRGGAAAAFYVGHGLAGGWAGYGGFGVASAAEAARVPLGAVLSLSCSTAARPRDGFSFCEELALTGLCSAALGAVSRTLHRLNVALALNLCSALAEDPCPTLASLLLACDWPQELLTRYRIIGDPLAPLAAAPAAAAAARTVFAPGPDDILPVVRFADWEKRIRATPGRRSQSTLRPEI